jgi:N-acetylglutamate synthase-like GNAT family acetyltransferase
MDQFIIKQASVQDAQDIYLVEKSAFPEERQASYEILLGRIKLFPGGCYVLILNNKIVAFSTALIMNQVDSISELNSSDQELYNLEGNTYELRSIAVMKEFQKQGLGKKLIKKQIANAKLLNKKYFQFTAARDVSEFYKKTGFKRVSKYEEFHNSKQALWEMELT